LYKLSNNHGTAKGRYDPNYSIERLMCEVEFFGRCVFVQGTRFFSVVRSPLPNYQIVDLESLSCFTNRFLKNDLLRLNVCVRIHDSPVGAHSDSNQFLLDSGIIKQMLLDCYPTLFLVEFCLGLAPSKFDC